MEGLGIVWLVLLTFQTTFLYMEYEDVSPCLVGTCVYPTEALVF